MIMLLKLWLACKAGVEALSASETVWNANPLLPFFRQPVRVPVRWK